MPTLLHLDSSAKGSISATHALTKYFADRWMKSTPDGKVIYRDLASSDLPFVNEEMITAFFTPPDSLSQEQKKLCVPSDALLAELFEADVYLFGVPMYNFTVPASFKAYIDLIVRAGKTFSYEGGYPKGLIHGKQIFIATASGGDYSLEMMKQMDFLQPYLRALFSFLGVKDLKFITMHGKDEATISATSALARQEIDKIIEALRSQDLQVVR